MLSLLHWTKKKPALCFSRRHYLCLPRLCSLYQHPWQESERKRASASVYRTFRNRRDPRRSAQHFWGEGGSRHCTAQRYSEIQTGDDSAMFSVWPLRLLEGMVCHHPRQLEGEGFGGESMEGLTQQAWRWCTPLPNVSSLGLGHMVTSYCSRSWDT